MRAAVQLRVRMCPLCGRVRRDDRRKTAGDRRTAAQRNLLGCLHHCLATGQPYDETAAFPATDQAARAMAA